MFHVIKCKQAKIFQNMSSTSRKIDRMEYWTVINYMYLKGLGDNEVYKISKSDN